MPPARPARRRSRGNRTHARSVVDGVERLPGRAGLAWRAGSAAAIAAATVCACASAPSGSQTVPAEFQHACGHPGAQVTVRTFPVTISHADRDLTGVAISIPGRGGATVPRGGGSTGNSMGFTLTARPGTLDVTVNATGSPGNE